MRARSRGVFRSTVPGLALATAVGLTACGDSGPAGPVFSLDCSVPLELIFEGGPPPDGIPALTDPELASVGEPAIAYLRDTDRVIGIVVDGQAIAVPHNIGWWHEIVNFNIAGASLAVTYCPLTGSSLVFDRSGVGGEFGVSGLLYQNNLLMYDRTGSQSLWPQMQRSATCGPRVGTPLPMVAAVDMTWGAWRALYPSTRAVSENTGWDRNYRFNPYEPYMRLGNELILYPVSNLDRRRPLKEPVLGIVGADGGVAFPFGELDGAPRRAVNETVDGRPLVVFWSRDAQAAIAYEAVLGGQSLSFHVDGGEFVDAETGSRWNLLGVATSGPFAGERLAAVAESHLAFWFAWPAFNPGTRLWLDEG